MRKTSVLCALLLVLGATLVVAGPAHADCVVEPPPRSSTVYLENGQLRVNPNGPAQDLEAVGQWIDYHVGCIQDAPVLDPVECVGGLGVGGPYVYEDPNTGELVVAYQALIDHIAAIVACA